MLNHANKQPVAAQGVLWRFAKTIKSKIIYPSIGGPRIFFFLSLSMVITGTVLCRVVFIAPNSTTKNKGKRFRLAPSPPKPAAFLRVAQVPTW